MTHSFKKNLVVKYLSSLKLGIILILVFMGLAIWGTIIESKYGAAYARDLVYVSPFFLLLQVLLFVNILFSLLVRLPFQKKLFGFYIIHLGLLCLMLGAGLTLQYGLDGKITLYEKASENTVYLDDQVLVAKYLDVTNQQVLHKQKDLPKTVRNYSSKQPFLQLTGYDLYLESYLPFADSRWSWQPMPADRASSQVVLFDLSGQGIYEPMVLSDLEEARLQQVVGPLIFEIAPHLAADCLQKLFQNNKLFAVVQYEDSCYAVTRTDGGKPSSLVSLSRLEKEPVLKFKIASQEFGDLYFYPEHTYFPVKDEYSLLTDVPVLLVIRKKIEQGNRILFLKDDQVAVIKDQQLGLFSWEESDVVPLPWMDLKLTIRQIKRNVQYVQEWFPVLPEPDDNTRHIAAQIRLTPQSELAAGEITTWISNTQDTAVSTDTGADFNFFVTNGLFHLPFSLELEKFHMEQDPGSLQPASYESFVILKQDGISQKAHISMNHPLKNGRFTLYQSSYFQDKTGSYASILSVNYDPGRWIKYLGALLLVFGCVWKFIL